jgi:hypothetical protein
MFPGNSCFAFAFLFRYERKCDLGFDDMRIQRAFTSPVAVNYKVATLLLNMRTCMRGYNEVAEYMGLAPPSQCSLVMFHCVCSIARVLGNAVRFSIQIHYSAEGSRCQWPSLRVHLKPSGAGQGTCVST